MNKKKPSFKKALLIVAVIAAGVAGYIWYWNNWPYWGKVVDAETGKPIVGAVVVAEWLESEPSVGGVLQKLKDIKEAVADENGEWKIRAPSAEAS